MALPEVEEKPHFGRPGFRVRDKLFASIHVEVRETFAIVNVDELVVASELEEDPDVFQAVWRSHGKRRIFVGLKVDLGTVSDERCRELIERAWRKKAPKRLASEYGGT